MATDLKLDISNPNAITYITEELGFTIRVADARHILNCIKLWYTC